MNRVFPSAIAFLTIAPLSGCVAQDQTKTRTDNTSALGWPEEAPTTPAQVTSPPSTDDFVVGVIVTEQKCFGSAGCIYRYTINPQYLSSKPLPDKTPVIYTVTGGEQEQIGNFTIDAEDTATFDRETSISGPENAPLRATVTQVISGR